MDERSRKGNTGDPNQIRIMSESEMIIIRREGRRCNQFLAYILAPIRRYRLGVTHCDNG